MGARARRRAKIKERAMVVARDCLLASVECKILTSAMQELQMSGIAATWEELIAFRRDHVGTPGQADRLLAHEMNRYRRARLYIRSGLRPRYCPDNA